MRNAIVCTRGQRLPGPAKQQSRQWKQGDRVIVSLSSEAPMSGIVLEAKASVYTDVQNCRVRVAKWNSLVSQWVAYELRDWVLGTRLTERDGESIAGLDTPKEAEAS